MGKTKEPEIIQEGASKDAPLKSISEFMDEIGETLGLDLLGKLTNVEGKAVKIKEEFTARDSLELAKIFCEVDDEVTTVQYIDMMMQNRMLERLFEYIYTYEDGTPIKVNLDKLTDEELVNLLITFNLKKNPSLGCIISFCKTSRKGLI